MSQEEIRTIGVRDIPKYQAREDVIWIDVRERDWIKVRPMFFTVKEEVLA